MQLNQAGWHLSKGRLWGLIFMEAASFCVNGGGRLIVREQRGQARPAKRREVFLCLEQVQGVGASNRLGAALHTQFAVDVVDVALHRADGDDELPRHGVIGQALHQQT